MIKFPLDWHIPAWNQLYQYAQNNKLPHALLLTGPNGTGKSQFSHTLAQLLLCKAPQWTNEAKRYTACNQCQSCHWWQAQTHPNYYRIKPEGESKTPKIVIEQIRDLIESLQKTAKKNAYNAAHHYPCIVVIQSAEYLNTAAGNALLKTLEEPLPGILFILTADQPQNLLITIQSRCQRVMLPIPSFQTSINWLKYQLHNEQPSINPQQLETVLKLANDLPLKALELIQQPETVECYAQLFNSLLQLQRDTVNPIQIAKEWSTHSIELVFNYLYQSFYTLIQLKLDIVNIMQASVPISEEERILVDKIHLTTLFHWIDVLQKTKEEMKRYSLNTVLVLENLAIQFSSSE